MPCTALLLSVNQVILHSTAITICHQVAVEVGQNSKIYINMYNVHIALCLLCTLMKTRYIAIPMYACFKIKLGATTYDPFMEHNQPQWSIIGT